nr:D96 [uncultured bacterium]
MNKLKFYTNVIFFLTTVNSSYANQKIGSFSIIDESFEGVLVFRAYAFGNNSSLKYECVNAAPSGGLKQKTLAINYAKWSGNYFNGAFLIKYRINDSEGRISEKNVAFYKNEGMTFSNLDATNLVFIEHLSENNGVLYLDATFYNDIVEKKVLFEFSDKILISDFRMAVNYIDSMCLGKR